MVLRGRFWDHLDMAPAAAPTTFLSASIRMPFLVEVAAERGFCAVLDMLSSGHGRARVTAPERVGLERGGFGATVLGEMIEPIVLFDAHESRWPTARPAGAEHV